MIYTLFFSYLLTSNKCPLCQERKEGQAQHSGRETRVWHKRNNTSLAKNNKVITWFNIVLDAIVQSWLPLDKERNQL